MKLLEDLRAEHALIESVVGSIANFADAYVRNEVAPENGEGYVRFFELFAGRFHHAREEEVLFPALVHETDVPADRGPIAVLLAEHAAMATMLETVAALFQAPANADNARRLAQAVARYGGTLLHHIDAENSVLFPESVDRFRRTSVLELATRLPDEHEAAAREAGVRLLSMFAPIEIPGVHRGDGCVACSAYGVSCDGVEREWSTALEWEDAIDRLSSG